MSNLLTVHISNFFRISTYIIIIHMYYILSTSKSTKKVIVFIFFNTMTAMQHPLNIYIFPYIIDKWKDLYSTSIVDSFKIICLLFFWRFQWWEELLLKLIHSAVLQGKAINVNSRTGSQATCTCRSQIHLQTRKLTHICSAGDRSGEIAGQSRSATWKWRNNLEKLLLYEV